MGLALQGIAELVTDGMAAATIEESIDRLDGVVERLRAYIFELRSQSEKRQLDERLQELVARLGSAYPATVSLDMGVELIDGGHLEDEVVMFVAETLSNALRHANATEVEVGVDAIDGWCRIITRDNGAGFDTSSATTGMGLANLRGRAAALAGHVSVTSAPNVGTLVEIAFPIS